MNDPMTNNIEVLRGLVALIKGAQGRPFTVAEKAELLIRADELDAALAALGGEQGWRPIETAPRDGREILGWFEGSTVQIFYLSMGGQWVSDLWDDREPTHWMPLPPPPGGKVGG